MRPQRTYRSLVPALAVLAWGCVIIPIHLTTVKSSGVDRIPLKLGVFPLLSAPMGQDKGFRNRVAALSMQLTASRASIIPPVDFELSMTRESQMMTDLVSSGLAARGFLLKQLPVEVRDKEGAAAGREKEFFVSMGLLKELRQDYGVEGVLLGNVFLGNERSPANELVQRVHWAHLKVVDSGTLDVLAQVTLPERSAGYSMEEIAEAMAQELFKLTGQKRTD